MLLLVIILLCILVSTLLLQTAIIKATVFAFRKGGLSWRTALVMSLIVEGFAILSILGRFSLQNLITIPVELLCILGIILLPTIVLKRSLHIKTSISIAMVLVATAANSIAGVAYASGVRTFFMQAFRIQSAGMTPTLDVGDHMLMNKLAYRFGTPHRGEVVVLRYPADTSYDFVQRIVAVGGDTVEVRDKKVFVNGKRYEKDPGVNLDTEILKSPRDKLPPLTVPPGGFFLLGDNRDHSFDSRFWGFAKREHLVGRPFLIYWSYDEKTKRVRTERIGERVR